MKKIVFIVLTLSCLYSGCTLIDKENVSIIPEPVSIKIKYGFFTFDNNTTISFNNIDKNNSTVTYIVEYFEKYFGFNPTIVTPEHKVKNCICFSINSKKDIKLGDEGYRLKIKRNRIIIEANTTTGLFYGFQTLYQLAPNNINKNNQTKITFSCLEILDYPRFEWRGNHLDVSRHFFDVEYIKKHLDILALYKINKFHWHLTDDHGWRIKIDKYPKLTEVGAWRVDRSQVSWTKGEPPKEGEKASYGGYYTKDQIREVVAYAAQRHIDVVPEIEIPGHCSAILASYPEFACDDYPYFVQIGPYWPPKAIMCAGNDKVIQFYKDVIDEIASLFPYEYIHIGGDEAVNDNWKKCPKCQNRIKEQHLKNEAELQSWMIREIEKKVINYGKNIIGWDEILDGGVSKNATIMSWRGENGAITAARQGNNAIMTPIDYCYFNFYQADPKTEPEAMGGYVPLEKVYSYEPIPDSLKAEEQKYIIGAQCNLWAEFLYNSDIVEYMLLPRLCALSEIVWSPKEKKDWNHFKLKIIEHKKRLDALGYQYCDIFAPIDNSSQKNKK